MKRIFLALLVLASQPLPAQTPPAELEARLAEASGEERLELLAEVATAYLAEEDVASALTHFRSALKLAREMDNRPHVARNLLAIGRIHLRDGRLPAAAETLRRARVAAGEIDAPEVLLAAHEASAEAYGALGRYREAYDSLRSAEELRRTVDDRQRAGRVAELEAELESERQKAELESSRLGQEVTRLERRVADFESRSPLSGSVAPAAAGAAALLLVALVLSLVFRRRLASRTSQLIANRDLELEQTSDRLAATAGELERASGELERKTFEHNRAASELVQTSALLDRATARLEEATAVRDQTAVSLAETSTQLQRAEDELGRTSGQLDQALRQLEEREKELQRLKHSYRQDIAELGDRNAVARERLDEMERFSSTVAQHLKILLVAVRSSLGALEQDAAAGDVEQLRRDVERTRGAVGKTVRLLDRLLQLLLVGRLVHAPEEAPMSELAFEAVGQVAGLVANRRAEIVIAPEMPSVFGDRAQVLEVLRHLLENGGKFMGDQPAPRIEVGSRREETAGEPEIVFFVRDNGIGIDPRDHGRVFTLFERLDPEQGGAGIGLALVRRILEAHGGRIWVESEGAGRGSTFCFTLPEPGAGEGRDGPSRNDDERADEPS